MTAKALDLQDTARLTAEEVTRYRREGWLSVPQRVLEDADLDLVRRCCLAVEERDPLGPDNQTAIKQDGAKAFSYRTDPSYRRMFRTDFNLRLAFPELRPVVSRVGAVARALLGTDDIRILWDQTFTKPPASDGTRATVWHQDLPYIPLDRRGLMTIWMPLQDVAAEAGALRFVPRSHHLGPLGRISFLSGSDPGLEDLLQPEDFDVIGSPVTVPVKAGGATVHDGLTLHGAGPNQSEQPRRVWACVFYPGDALWTGGPFVHANFAEYGLKPFDRLDHPDLRVGRSPPP